MADRVTLDVIDRPAGGVLGVLRQIKAIRRASPPGLRAIVTMGTADFAARVRPAPTPRRIAILAAWDDPDALGDLAADAKEHWHVEAEVVRAAFSDDWKGWTPDTAGARPLDPGEPALILISGELHARYVPGTYEAARDYAYRPGGHLDAMQRDRARGHHRTQYFLRLRPLAERASLGGRRPLAPVLYATGTGAWPDGTSAASSPTRVGS
jgi:hypothetical protein